ncbi:hypothetical protein EDB86DRAFT_2826327 [Lactarius hatsudake]|nr:hypothetical protein EDB86DRAFT_2826327 [Lactarius hatsudake]
MSSPSLTLVSYSQFETILGTALGEYKNKTGNDLLDNWLAKELQSRDSVDTILDIIQHQAEAFDKFRYDDEKLMKWIGPSVRVLYKISATLSGGVDMALPSAKAVFAGIGVLLAEGKGVRENYHALAPLFQRIDFLLRRLGVQTRISPTEDLVKIHVKIAAEVLCILSIATKDAQQSRRKATSGKDGY